MRVAATIREMRALRRDMAGGVGLVPTMGYLHEGHLSLVRGARERDEHVVVSIFVNPTQFGSNEDYQRYPRDEQRDLDLLRAEHVDVVFVPTAEEMYPEAASTFVEVEGFTDVLEGAHRPGHFRGVTTIVTKLLNIVQPRRAYFSWKDAQQLLVVRRLASDLDLDIEIVPMPFVREPDGLAMSSRNAVLSPRQHEAALVLSKALRLTQKLFGEGERDGGRLRDAMRELIAREPLARIDYVSVADRETLRELDSVTCPALVSLAVRIAAPEGEDGLSVRLIDNVTVEPA